MQAYTADLGMSLEGMVRQIAHNNLLIEQEIHRLQQESF